MPDGTRFVDDAAHDVVMRTRSGSSRHAGATTLR